MKWGVKGILHGHVSMMVKDPVAGGYLVIIVGYICLFSMKTSVFGTH